MSRNDRDYYQRREQQERKLADNAGDSTARRAHLVMADHYSGLFRQTEEKALG